MLKDEQISCLLDIANAGCHKGFVEEARAIYDGVLAIKPGHVPALIGQALSHIVIGEFSQGEEALLDILAKDPQDAEATAMLGLCFFLEGKKDEAREKLESIGSEHGGASALAAALLEQLA
ncbi:MAG: tetratricopeptide repeat protein [Mailhella sp.]|jgi:Flp pilus assembly protein TadD|nr:tetratricopeptide repeat protein [Mailhella sp.]